MGLRIDDLTLATTSVTTDEIEFSLTGAAGSRKMRMIDLRSMLLTAFGGAGNVTDYLTIGASPPANGTIRLNTGTVTTDLPAFNALATWNAGAVTFTALRINVTNTASAAASMLADFQIATVSQWKVTRAGVVTQTGALNTGGGVTVTANASLFLKLSHNGSNTPAFIWLNGWNATQKNWQIDTGAIGNNFCITPSTAAGGFTFTTPTFEMTSAGQLTLTATAAAVILANRTDAAAALGYYYVQRAGSTKYYLGLDASDNGYCSATTFTFAGILDANGRVTTAVGSYFGWGPGTSTILRSPSDGIITLLNAAETGFTRLQFGGTTNAFPSLARSATDLQARLADNSALTHFYATSLVAGGVAKSAAAGEVSYGGSTQTTVGAAGAASALPANPTGYVIINVAGTDRVFPFYAKT
jgi:hypothetical protein